MCVQPQPPAPEKKEQTTTTTTWLATETPLSQLAVQAGGPKSYSGQDTLKCPECEPMNRWINEGPADGPWHEAWECRLADDPGPVMPEHTSVESLPSSTGATTCSSRKKTQGRGSPKEL